MKSAGVEACPAVCAAKAEDPLLGVEELKSGEVEKSQFLIRNS